MKKVKIGENFYNFYVSTIISIPERMIINHESISNLYVNNTKSKYHNLWDKIFKLENQYLRYVSTKQLKKM